jgi:Fe-S-cluster containining protein
MTCQRCGLCCQSCGDLYAGTKEHGVCPQFEMKNGVASCKVYEQRPQVCRDYPFADIDNGKCFRELLGENIVFKCK